MIWQAFEKQRIGTLDAGLAEQLDEYLDQREAKLAIDINAAAHLLQGVPPQLDGYSDLSSMHLQQAVEEFSRKTSRIAQSPHDSSRSGHGFDAAVDLINKSLWHYTETLEGCVMELFQQLNQIGFEYWDIDLFQSVGEIKDGLTH